NLLAASLATRSPLRIRDHSASQATRLTIFVGVFVLLCAMNSIAFAQIPTTKVRPRTTGTLVSKTGTTLHVQVDGEEKPRRFDMVAPGNVLDPKAGAFAQSVAVGSLIEITWVADSGVQRVTNLYVMQTPGTF